MNEMHHCLLRQQFYTVAQAAVAYRVLRNKNNYGDSLPRYEFVFVDYSTKRSHCD
ncbi:MAG: hypothetical protein JW795_07960 [Chitinivibrionales bacterium]|nr:hypothetical protein [Chitinivibrionales bacterium]